MAQCSWLRESDDLEAAIDVRAVCVADTSAAATAATAATAASNGDGDGDTRSLGRSTSFSAAHLGKRAQPLEDDGLGGVSSKTQHLALVDRLGASSGGVNYHTDLFMAAQDELVEDDGYLEISVQPRQERGDAVKSSVENVVPNTEYQADADFFCF